MIGLQIRIRELEELTKRLQRASVNLHLYVKTVHGLPDRDEWDLIVEQIADLVDPYESRNARV